MAESAGAPGWLPPRVPVIRRARGYRLYGFDGRRCLDLFQDGGRAVLGHRFGPAVAAMASQVPSESGTPSACFFARARVSASPGTSTSPPGSTGFALL